MSSLKVDCKNGHNSIVKCFSLMKRNFKKKYNKL